MLGTAAIKEVTYGYWLRRSPELLRLAEARTADLEEKLGTSAFSASAEWDRTLDVLGRPLVTLRLTDFSGSATMVFEPSELEDPAHMRDRFALLWLMLLEIRSTQQLQELHASLNEEGD